MKLLILQILPGDIMARTVGKIPKKKGKFYYVDKEGNVIEKDRSEMLKKKSKTKKRKG